MPTTLTTIKFIVLLALDIEIPFLSRLCDGRITFGDALGGVLGLAACGFLIWSWVRLVYVAYYWCF